MSYSNDFQLGQPVTDHFTHVTLSFMESLREGSEASLQELMGAYR
jgi:glycosylphosphatidylinositol transamidase (GPIT) subunit GPI8